MTAKLAILALALGLFGAGSPLALAATFAAPHCASMAAEMPCGDGEPCTSFAAKSCCDVTPAAPAPANARNLDGLPSSALIPAMERSLSFASADPGARATALAHATSSLRLSVVLRS